MTTLAEKPLLLILDDLQWADPSSLALLFRLGRRTGQSRTLLIGTYRPEEIAQERAGRRHPLEKVIAELKRYQGEVELSLDRVDEADRRGFIDSFLDSEPNALDGEFRRALRQHLEENTLPGVALYQTLLADQDTEARAMPFIEGVFQEWGTSSRRAIERLGRLPVFYWLLRALVKPMMRLNFPAEGWETEWLETSGTEIAFNMKSCFYLDVLDEYGVPQLTAQYCRLDDLIYEDVSPYVKWARKRTLGRGDECCDFRFERVGNRT